MFSWIPIAALTPQLNLNCVHELYEAATVIGREDQLAVVPTMME